MSSSSRRPISPVKALSLVLVFLLLSTAGGILAAGFAAPFVGATSAITNASKEFFDELPEDFTILSPSQISVMKASDGTEIAQFYAENRIVVSLDNISINMQHAIVAVEDKRFYQHKGVDPTGILRALVSNSNDGSTQGASTLTQQYVRNVLVEAATQSNDKKAMKAATEKTTARKLREIKYALTLEQKYPDAKQKILEGYLNIAAFSPSTYGVEASAQHYFSHSAKELTIPEAALLAGLTNAPSAYDPITHPEEAKKRMDWVLEKMLEEQFITQEEHDAGVATTIDSMLHVTNEVGGCGTAGDAAYFCNYVVGEIENSDLYGASLAERRKLLLRGGLSITTTLDRGKQGAANSAVQAYVPTNDPSDVKAALVSVEPGTGKILAMAQNTNFGDSTASDPSATQISFAADAKHGGLQSNGFQPGSAFKPFVLAEWYAQHKSGYASMNTDPTVFNMSQFTACGSRLAGENWKVGNSNSSEGGTHNVIQNTAMSINVGYVRMLAQLDICDVSKLAATLGVTKTDGSELEARPSIVLGAQEVTPMAMANAYATFAGHGVYCKPIAINSIKDASGNDMAVPSADCSQALEATAADQVALTLTNVLTSKGTAPNAALAGRQGAGKTGTTEEMDNAWFVGFTPQLSTAVWLGHSDGYYTMAHQTIGGHYYSTMYGSDAPASLWKTYMDSALAGQPAQAFNQVGLGAGGASNTAGSGSTSDQGTTHEASSEATTSAPGSATGGATSVATEAPTSGTFEATLQASTPSADITQPTSAPTSAPTGTTPTGGATPSGQDSGSVSAGTTELSAGGTSGGGGLAGVGTVPAVRNEEDS